MLLLLLPGADMFAGKKLVVFSVYRGAQELLDRHNGDMGSLLASACALTKENEIHERALTGLVFHCLVEFEGELHLVEARLHTEEYVVEKTNVEKLNEILKTKRKELEEESKKDASQTQKLAQCIRHIRGLERMIEYAKTYAVCAD